MVIGTTVYIAGTWDTKAKELDFLASLVRADGLTTQTVDLSTSSSDSAHCVDVTAAMVAEHHPNGPSAVFSGDRGSAIDAMTLAFDRFVASQTDIAGILAIGGSGGTALVAPAMRKLPLGLPKIIVSTMMSGNIAGYVGQSDIMMIYPVADLAGLNRITRPVLANAAMAMIGMVRGHTLAPGGAEDKPIAGLTMFGVTTPCVRMVSEALEHRFDCIPFHATGVGGQAMMSLVQMGMIDAVLDLTTTEIADMIVGGIFPAQADRFDPLARHSVPYVGSCGALDMVNFGPLESMPAKFSERNIYKHNSQITLIRTTPEENAAIGQWIGAQLNRSIGEVRFLIPERGVSALDAPGMPFHDPDANARLFASIENTVRRTDSRHILRLPYHINDREFAEAIVGQLGEIA
jgi:uncharacterized protein (UPF0261 family)